MKKYVLAIAMLLAGCACAPPQQPDPAAEAALRIIRASDMVCKVIGRDTSARVHVQCIDKHGDIFEFSGSVDKA